MTRQVLLNLFIGIMLILIAVWGGTWLMDFTTYQFASITTAMIVGVAGCAWVVLALVSFDK